MFTHGPSCLNGPVSRERGWWTEDELDNLPCLEAAGGTTNAPVVDSVTPGRPIRWELVERVRREIAAGTYETPEKLQIALERIIERLYE